MSEGTRRVRRTSVEKEGFDPKTALRAFRRRMHYVGEVIRELFGAQHNGNPEMATRAAYLTVVARIIQALNDDNGTLSTDQLASLSKVLAEQRRLDISEMELERRLSKDTPKEGAPEGVSKSLPQDFNRIVEQIYGTNLDAQNEPTDAESPAPNPP